MKKQLQFLIAYTFLAISFYACDYVPNKSNIIAAKQSIIDTGLRYTITQKDTIAVKDTTDSLKNIKPDSLTIVQKPDTIPAPAKPVVKPVATINSKAITIIDYAKSMLGKPYVYGANTPEKGFDNSGFVNYIFSHFNITVPRYAAAFIAAGDKVVPNEVSEGDIILFSKTDSVKKVVFQIGIVVSAKGAPVSFIYASSGKINGVGISNMNAYYQKKLMGYRRVF